MTLMGRVAGLSWLLGFLAVSSASAAGRTPSIESSTWLNTPDGKAPQLDNRPVLVEFWTFG